MESLIIIGDTAWKVTVTQSKYVSEIVSYFKLNTHILFKINYMLKLYDFELLLIVM